MEEWRKRWNAVKAFFGSSKGKAVLVAAGLLGIALIALSELRPDTSSEKTAAPSHAEQYIDAMEKKLETLVSHMEGAGACRVMVTLESGVEYVYATEEKNTSDLQEDTEADRSRRTARDGKESSVILVDDNGLLVTEIQPTVRGVIVACEGGDRDEVRERIIEAVTVAMNLSSRRVCVTKLS